MVLAGCPGSHLGQHPREEFTLPTAANLKCLPHGGQSAASRIPADELIFQTEHLASPQNRGSVAEVRYVRSTPSGNVR
jgi:hypothetical protein